MFLEYYFTPSEFYRKVDQIMAGLSEAVKGWRDYAGELRSQRDAALALAREAGVRAQASADALQKFQDDDAVTDAQQIADQVQADADFVTSELDSFKAEGEPTEPPAEEPPVEEPPVEETPPTEETPPVEETPPAEEAPAEEAPVTDISDPNFVAPEPTEAQV